MDDQNNPQEPNRYQPQAMPPPVNPYAQAQPFPQQQPQQPQQIPTPYMAGPQRPVVQWEQNLSGPMAGTSTVVSQPGMPVDYGNPSGKKRGLIVGMISVIFLTLLGVGGVVAYTMWSQTPEKILGDSIANLMKADTTVLKATYTSETKADEDKSSGGISLLPIPEFTKTKFTLDAKATRTAAEADLQFVGTADGKERKLEAGAVFGVDGNLYVRVDKLDEFVSSKNTDAATLKIYEPIFKAINGKWINIPLGIVTSESTEEMEKKQKCVKDVWTAFEKDKATKDEFIKLFVDNNFIVIDKKLGTENGSIGFKIKIDEEKLNQFMEGANKTKVFQDLQKCDKETYTLKPSTPSKEKEKDEEEKEESTESYEIWVSEQKHEITKFTGSRQTKQSTDTFVIEATFNAEVKIEAPKGALTYEEIMALVQKAMMSAYPSTAIKDQSTDITLDDSDVSQPQSNSGNGSASDET